MKVKIIVIATIIIISLTACGGRSSNSQNTHSHESGTAHSHNTHTHADGTVHSDHAPEQESFKVETDSNTVEQNHTHKH